MSARGEIYGIITGYAGTTTGLNGETLQQYWVDTSWGGERWVGFSVKGVDLTAGDVVDIIDCGLDGDPWAGWGLVRRAVGLPSAYAIKHWATARGIESDFRYKTTCAMNWLCRAAGAVGRLYWPGRITAIDGSTVTVSGRWGGIARTMPVSSDLSVADFSVGDYVLVYAPSSGEICIGWWLMKPGESSFTVSITHNGLVAGEVGTFTVSIANTGTRSLYSVDTNISYLAGSLSELSATTWAAGAIARGETKTKEITATAGGSISVPDGWMTADVTTSDGLTGTTTKNFAIQQARVYIFAQGGDTLGIYCSPPGSSHYANAIVASGGGNIVVVYSEDGGAGEDILTMEGSYDTIYTTSVTGSVTTYTATATIGSDEGQIYTVVFTMDLSNGDISLSVSIT